MVGMGGFDGVVFVFGVVRPATPDGRWGHLHHDFHATVREWCPWLGNLDTRSKSDSDANSRVKNGAAPHADDLPVE